MKQSSYTYKMVLEYDGSDFCGWQTQEKRPTIQAKLEAILSLLFHQKITVTGSGRTDSGVHALAQIAHFRSDSFEEPEKILTALNAHLKPFIVVREVLEVEPSFHAQRSAKSKIYTYLIWNDPLPSILWGRYAWHLKKKIDWDLIKPCLDRLIGTHDFKSFQSVGTPVKTTTRTIYQAFYQQASQDLLKPLKGEIPGRNQMQQIDFPWLPSAALYGITFEGSGFLKQMVRNLVGTLVQVGLGRISVSDFSSIFESKDRRKAAMAAPANGLFLIKVNY